MIISSLLTLTTLLLAPLAALYVADTTMPVAAPNIVHMLVADLGWCEPTMEASPDMRPGAQE